jgi:hypothetical protein
MGTPEPFSSAVSTVRVAKGVVGVSEKFAPGPPGVAITRPDGPIVTEPLPLPKAVDVIV